MGKVIVDITMSLDGFVTGPNDGPGNGLGDGGRVLHEWVFEGRTEADAQLLFEEPMKTLGSCVLGRRTFDIAEEAWGDDPACHLVGDLRSKVAADEVQEKIEPRSAACRRQD